MNYNIPNFNKSPHYIDSVDKYTKWYIMDRQFDLKGNPLLVTHHIYTNQFTTSYDKYYNRLNTGVCIGFKVLTELENVNKITFSGGAGEIYNYYNLKHNDVIYFQNLNQYNFNKAQKIKEYYSDSILQNALLCSYNTYKLTCPLNVYIDCYFINSLEERKNKSVNVFCFPFDTNGNYSDYENKIYNKYL